MKRSSVSSFKKEAITMSAICTSSVSLTTESGTALVRSSVLVFNSHCINPILVGYGGLSQDDHPWPVPERTKPRKKDFSKGVSRLYKGWILREEHIRESQGESSMAPKSEISAADTATSGPQIQPAVKLETCQESLAAATMFDPALPFASQVKPDPVKKASDNFS